MSYDINDSNGRTDLLNVLQRNRELQKAIEMEIIRVKSELHSTQALLLLERPPHEVRLRRVVRPSHLREEPLSWRKRNHAGEQLATSSEQPRVCFLDNHLPTDLVGVRRIQDPFSDGALFMRRPVGSPALSTIIPARCSLTSALATSYPDIPGQQRKANEGPLFTDNKVVAMRTFAAGVQIPSSSRTRVRADGDNDAPNPFSSFLLSQNPCVDGIIRKHWADSNAVVAHVLVTMMNEVTEMSSSQQILPSLIKLFNLPKWQHLQDFTEPISIPFLGLCRDRDILDGNEWVHSVKRLQHRYQNSEASNNEKIKLVTFIMLIIAGIFKDLSYSSGSCVTAKLAVITGVNVVGGQYQLEEAIKALRLLV